MKDYIWQRLANPVECALVRTGLMRVLRELLTGSDASAETARRQAMAYAERFSLVTQHEPIVLADTDSGWSLEASALAQVFVDPAYAELAARFEAWHRESAPRLVEGLEHAYLHEGERGLRPALAH